MNDGYGVYLGLDVGKGDHHAVGLAPDGKRLHDAALPNTEARLRQLFDKLARHGRVLVVVDQPASIGALPIAVARAAGHQVAYLPGLAMRRIADLHPGSAKTDARDAYVIADAARTLPHTLRRVDTGDDALAELEVLVGFDDDLAGEATRLSNRIRGLLTPDRPRPGTGPWPEGAAQGGAGAAVALRRTRRAAQGRPPQADLDRHRPRTPHGRPAGRADHDRTGRADRHRPRHDCSRNDPAPARLQPKRSCPASPTASATFYANATRSPPRSTGSLMRTLLPRS